MKVLYLFIFLLFVTSMFVQGTEKGQKNMVIGVVIRDVRDVITDLDSTLNNLEIRDDYKISVRNVRNKICISEGVCIVTVEDNSLAETIGLNVLDVVVGINDNKVDSLFSFNEKLNQCIEGDSLKITINRSGIEKVIHLVYTNKIEKKTAKRALKEEGNSLKPVSPVNEDSSIERSSDEFTGETLITTDKDNSLKPVSPVNEDTSIERSYDEFTGETLITTDIGESLNFAKTISETGKTFILLKWKSISDHSPENEKSKLIILFDDNSRLSIDLPIVSKQNEFWTSFYAEIAMNSGMVMDPTMYNLNSEVLLTPLQIEILKKRSIKKYRLEGYEAHEITNSELDTKNIFNKLLKAQ